MFFLANNYDGRVGETRLALKNVDELIAFAWAIRQALNNVGISGDEGKEIDHIEIFAPLKSQV